MSHRVLMVFINPREFRLWSNNLGVRGRGVILFLLTIAVYTNTV